MPVTNRRTSDLKRRGLLCVDLPANMVLVIDEQTAPVLRYALDKFEPRQSLEEQMRGLARASYLQGLMDAQQLPHMPPPEN